MPAATWTLRKTDAVDVETPPADEVRFFIDNADSLLKYKDELDVIRVAGPGLATSLVTADTPNPAAIDGTTPVAGSVPIADSPTQISYRSPNLLPGVVTWQDDPSTPETGNFTALIGRAHLVDISGGDVDAALPAAAANTLNREIWFKVVGLANGNRLRLDPDAAETIDITESELDLVLDGEWAKLRSDGAGNWYQFG